MSARAAWIILCCCIPILPVKADTEYFKRILFDNSLTKDRYFYTNGRASAPSTLTLDHGKLPVESARFFTGPNSLKLEWKSVRNGGWTVDITVPRWRNRELYFAGDTLYFWCFSPDAIKREALPLLVLSDSGGGFTNPLDIQPFTNGVPANAWRSIAIPLRFFSTASILAFDPHRVQGIAFLQGVADEVPHHLLLDEIRIDDSNLPRTPLPATPTEVHAQGYERHIDISWTAPDDTNVERYVIYRSQNGEAFRAIGTQERGVTRYSDWIGSPGQQRAYKVAASDRNYRESAPSAQATAETRPLTDDQLLTMVQEASFRYYWEAAHPVSGLTRENLPGRDEIVAMGASGFGMMSLIVGADRKFITRDQALERLTQCVTFLERADRFHGAWPHFLNGVTGHRLPVFGMFENGGDLVETAFLMQGLLTARGYFDRTSDPERNLRQRITKLWETVEWDWYRKEPDSDALYWHWSPEYSWYINHRLTGWNEVMIVYLLAIASPSHGVPASLYYTGWAGQSEAAVHYRQSYDKPVPGDHYSNGEVYDGVKLEVGVAPGRPLILYPLLLSWI